MNRKLQVFVSSTFTDLIEERQAAVSAILKAGHIPAGMELFTAGNKSQWDTITKWIDQSDIYMLILGGRYGSIEAESGLSYTELEYDYATKQGKLLFAIVASDDALETKIKSLGRKVTEIDHPDLLRDFRKKVLSNMSAFFSDEKDIRLAVMDYIVGAQSDIDPKSGWVKASTVVDTQSLEETIVRLRGENTHLVEKVKKLEASSKRSSSQREGDTSYENLRDHLSKQMLRVPEELVNDADVEHSVLDIAEIFLDYLVEGIRSSSSAKTSSWVYSKVLPQLALHGLAKSEKLTGTLVNVGKLSPEGLKFFSRYKMESNRSRKTLDIT